MTQDEIMFLQIADRVHREREALRPLMERLKEIMPKHVFEEQDGLMIRQFKKHPICRHADAFTGWLGGVLPADSLEMSALLWTFGEILCGDMERRLDTYSKIHHDFLNAYVQPSTMKEPDGDPNL